MCFFVYQQHAFDIAWHLKVEVGTFQGYDFVVAHCREFGVRGCVAERFGILLADKYVVGVGHEQRLQTVLPTFDIFGNVAASGTFQYVVDKGVAPCGEITAFAKAYYVVNRWNCGVCVEMDVLHLATERVVEALGGFGAAHQFPDG